MYTYMSYDVLYAVDASHENEREEAPFLGITHENLQEAGSLRHPPLSRKKCLSGELSWHKERIGGNLEKNNTLEILYSEKSAAVKDVLAE